MPLVTLSSGHCWVKGAITFIGPYSFADLDPDTNNPCDSFYLAGPGIKINIHSDDLWEDVRKANKPLRKEFQALYQEALNKIQEE